MESCEMGRGHMMGRDEGGVGNGEDSRRGVGDRERRRRAAERAG